MKKSVLSLKDVTAQLWFLNFKLHARPKHLL